MLNFARTFVAASLAGLMCANGALAGNLKVQVHNAADTEAKADVNSDFLDLIRNNLDGTWQFDLRKKQEIIVPIQVVVKELPPGYDSYPMRFVLPFFVDRSRPYTLATAVANDPTDDLRGIAPFLREMGTAGSTFRNSFVLLQRASRLWRARKAQLGNRNANEDDVAIAYWLLFAAADLAEKYYYQPDDVVQQAADWIGSLPADSSLYRRASSDKIDVLLTQLRSSEASVYEAMIGRLERDRDRDRQFVCAKFSSLDYYFGELTQVEKQKIDSEGGLTLKIKENVTWCAARTALSEPVVTPERKAELQQLVDQTNELLSVLPAETLAGRNANFVMDNIQVINRALGG